MTLWINAIFGNPSKVWVDLLSMVQGDLGLGDIPVITDPTVIQMTYDKNVNGVVQDRISAIINGVFPNQIIVTGVDSSYSYLNPNNGFWQSISATGGGVTVLKTGSLCAGSTPLYTNELIKVVYDTSACGGAGYWVRDINNNKVVEPPIVILFHELAHAYHWANRTAQVCTTRHAQAIGDENLIRGQLSLPKRHPTNDEGGCGAPSPYNPWEGGLDCFIVTAVSGSPRSVQVREFHRIRDSLLRPTRLGRALFATIFAEYYQCAPRIVADMQADLVLKELITRLVVEPLLDVLIVTELHVRLDLRSGSLDAELARILAQGRDRLSEAGIDPDTAARFSEVIAQIKAELEGAVAEPHATPPRLERSASETTFRYLASTILTSTPKTSALAWGLAQPLTIYWATLGRLMAGDEDPASLRDDLAEAIEDWLAFAPVDWRLADPGGETVTADLQSLAACVVTSRAVRHRFGAKMLDRGPAALRPHLAEALRAADFLPTAG